MQLDNTKAEQNEIMKDNVNSPAHYKTGDIECIDAMISAFGRKRVEEDAEIAAFKYL